MGGVLTSYGKRVVAAEAEAFAAAALDADMDGGDVPDGAAVDCGGWVVDIVPGF